MFGEGGSPRGMSSRRIALGDVRERAATASSASSDDGRGRAASSEKMTERVEVLANGLGTMLFEPAFSLEERELPPPDEIVAKQRPAIISTTPAAQLKQIEALFKLFDTAGNSLIDRDDLKRAYVKLGYLCTDDKAIDKHLAQLDLSGDGGEYGIDFNQFALGILNGNSFIFKALYSFDDKAAVEQIPGLGLSAAAVNPLRSASGSILEDDDAAPRAEKSARHEATVGKRHGLTPPYKVRPLDGGFPSPRLELRVHGATGLPSGSVFGVSDSTRASRRARRARVIASVPASRARARAARRRASLPAPHEQGRESGRGEAYGDHPKRVEAQVGGAPHPRGRR